FYIGDEMLFPLENLVLTVLYKKEMYGYEILKEVEKLSAGYFRPKSGTLYPILKRLEKKNLISAEFRELNGNSKKYYYLTDRGFKELEKSWRMVSKLVDFRAKYKI
ncbi:MAG: PadR family transcriptional regulator, partial [Candidatus Methanofastidiosia archaeon]